MSQMKLTNDEISQKLKDLHSIKMIFSVNKNCMDTGQQEYKQNIAIWRKVYILIEEAKIQQESLSREQEDV